MCKGHGWRRLAGVLVGAILLLAACTTGAPDTPTVAPTATAVPATDTPAPVATATPAPPAATDTSALVATDTPAAPAPTDTAVIAPTDTVPVPATVTPGPRATDTAAPAPTDTAAPAPTDTAAPVPTDTAAPAATETAAPAPTNTAAPPTGTPAAGGPTPTAAPVGAWQLVSTAVRNPRAALVAAPGGGALYAGGNGVYRSTDAGRTWNALTTGFPVTEIAVAPSDPRVLYAGTGEGCASGLAGPLQRSDDDGATWTAVTGGAFSLQVDPADANHVLGLRCDGVYTSHDGGVTWQKVAGAGVPNYDGYLLVRAPSNPARLYAVYASEGGTPALQRSDDRGASWRTLPAPGTTAPQTVVVDPRDANHLYFVGPAGFFASADGGQTWHAHNGGLPPAATGFALSSLALDTVSAPPAGASATLYISNDFAPEGAPSVLRWDGNAAWVPVAGAPDGRAINRLLVVNDPAGPALIALTNAGLYRRPLR